MAHFPQRPMLILRGRFSLQFGQFWSSISYHIVPFQETNGLTGIFWKLYQNILENWHDDETPFRMLTANLNGRFSATFHVSSWEPGFSSDFGEFWAVIRFRIGPFLEMNGLIGQDSQKNLSGSGKNWHFWRIIITNANRELKWPIFRNISGLISGSGSAPRIEQFWAVFIFQIGPFLEMNGLTRILKKCCRNLEKLTFLTNHYYGR